MVLTSDEYKLSQIHLEIAQARHLLYNEVNNVMERAIAEYLTALRLYEQEVANGCSQPSYSVIELPKLKIADAFLSTINVPTSPYIPPAQEPSSRGIKRIPVPTEIRWEVWERDNFTCKTCGVRKDLTIDHILAVVNGGTNDLENLQTLCFSCNSRKGAR